MKVQYSNQVCLAHSENTYTILHGKLPLSFTQGEYWSHLYIHFLTLYPSSRVHIWWDSTVTHFPCFPSRNWTILPLYSHLCWVWSSSILTSHCHFLFGWHFFFSPSLLLSSAPPELLQSMASDDLLKTIAELANSIKRKTSCFVFTTIAHSLWWVNLSSRGVHKPLLSQVVTSGMCGCTESSRTSHSTLM